jgi:hypothetical protein
MQKFENGDEVEVFNSSENKWERAEYVCLHKGEHLAITYTNYEIFDNDEIRPAQLICDEAREWLAKNRNECIKFKVSTEQISKELQELLFFLGLKWERRDSIPKYLNKTELGIHSGCIWHSLGVEKNYIELNLSTGEVTGGEELKESEVKSLFKETDIQFKNLKNQLKEKYEKIKQLKQVRRSQETEVKHLCGVIEEKEAEIERLKNQRDFSNEMEDKANQYIAEQKKEIHRLESIILQRNL